MTFKEEFDFQILKLTDAFYEAYPNPPFTEILKKKQRAYDCLLLQTERDYFICIPYRSQISHSNAFYFKKSVRSRRSQSGLDYSKAVVIQNAEYIGKEDAVIDHDCDHVGGKRLLHEKKFARRYKYSPLRYFHKELKLLTAA